VKFAKSTDRIDRADSTDWRFCAVGDAAAPVVMNDLWVSVREQPRLVVQTKVNAVRKTIILQSPYKVFTR